MSRHDTRSRRAGRAPLALAVLVLAACGRSPSVVANAQPSGDVVAEAGERRFTLEEVDARALQQNAGAFSGTLQQALYDARRLAIDQLVADYLVEREAEARGTTAAELFQQEVGARILPVTDADVEAWYRGNPDRVRGAPLEQVSEPIRDLLARERRQAAFNAFLDRLKSKTPVRVLLEPPRVAVRAMPDDPAAGPPNARVEIIEFSDFQ